MPPRTASTVENNSFALRQTADALLEILNPLGFSGCANVFRAWNVRLLVKLLKSNLQDQRLHAGIGLKEFRQCIRLDHCGFGTSAAMTCPAIKSLAEQEVSRKYEFRFFISGSIMRTHAAKPQHGRRM